MTRSIRPDFSRILPVVAGVALSLSAFSASALVLPPQVALADLITNNQSITIGDKTFSSFSYEISGHFLNYTDALDMASDIFVHPDVVDGNIGLDFVGTWGVVLGKSATAELNYTVTVDPASGYHISDFHLDSDLTVSGTDASGSAIVRETVSDINHVDIPMLGATDNPLIVQQVVPGSSMPNDSAFLAPGLNTKYARVETTISLTSNNLTTSVGLGHIQQTVSQVPEPHSYLLILSGLMGVGLMRLVRGRSAFAQMS
jgi:hypothetical protein